jgi:hypothetical protein
MAVIFTEGTEILRRPSIESLQCLENELEVFLRGL